jgi:hypothetical protein
VSDSPSGGFRPDSPWASVGSRVTIELRGERGRYYLVWVKLPSSGGVGHVNEVTAK